MEVDRRKLQILQAIVDDFVRTNTPVGSRTLSKTCGLGVSSATIRNEMADLEEMGYLIQPHVSAGRLPSDKAYRLYVDTLMVSHMTQEERDRTCRYFADRVHNMEDVITLCAQTLSELTGYTALVMAPRQSDLRVAALQMVPSGRSTALLIIITDAGIIRNTTLRVSDRMDAGSLFAISSMLTERLRGQTLREVRDMLHRYAVQGEADARVLRGVVELADQMESQNERDRVMVSGLQNILQYPEYADVAKARAFMNLMDHRESLISLMHTGSDTVQVRIGEESGIAELSGCSVVTAPYVMGRGHMGAIGVIGPTRMDYARVMETIDLVARQLTELMQIRE